MKTQKIILIAFLIVISNISFSVNHKSSNPATKPEDTNSQKEMYVSIDGDIYKIDATDKAAAPVKININTKYEECSPALSIDGNTLYFVSDRKGGYGGKDIWASERLSDGSWCKPYNLGPQINTCKDENDPVILDDGVTLTYTSNGRNDTNENKNFSSTMNDEGLWALPEKTE
ncbi:MAG: hypothetical protein V1904_04005 [Bacteroidota bacterium]